VTVEDWDLLMARARLVAKYAGRRARVVGVSYGVRCWRYAVRLDANRRAGT
jgi:hypothetical protein